MCVSTFRVSVLEAISVETSHCVNNPGGFHSRRVGTELSKLSPIEVFISNVIPKDTARPLYLRSACPFGNSLPFSIQSSAILPKCTLVPALRASSRTLNASRTLEISQHPLPLSFGSGHLVVSNCPLLVHCFNRIRFRGKFPSADFPSDAARKWLLEIHRLSLCSDCYGSPSPFLGS